VVIQDAVTQWQTGLLAALGGVPGWTDTADGTYWTDKPDWDGYGGLLLLAAYDEQPKLRPGSRRGLMRGGIGTDSPNAFQESAAYKRASARPSKYISLLSRVEWWLPLDDAAAVFEGPRVTGQPTRMSTVKQLVSELEGLAATVGISSEAELEQIRQAGPGDPAASDVETAGRFGLAAFLGLARQALAARQPLLLDY